MRTARLERRRMAEDATAHNDTYTYESNQDIYEQRKLRRDYRALLASAQSMYLISLMKKIHDAIYLKAALMIWVRWCASETLFTLKVCNIHSLFSEGTHRWSSRF